MRLAALALLAACAHVDPVHVVDGCRLTVPPPEKPAIRFQRCDGYEACLSLQDAKALLKWVRQADDWQWETWERCGTGPAR